ncbi:MAG: transposase [Bacteroidetes bacterium]|nr:transposase [Bacteroidota bacterium]
MERYKEKYRIQSARMPGWDYTRGGKYYVTICTRNRICCFGDVANGEMKLNEMGKIVRDHWLEIPESFMDTYLDAFQIMPNHIHGIVVMKRLLPETNQQQPECRDKTEITKRDETWSRLYIPKNISGNISKNRTMAAISPQKGSLSVIIGGWKSKCKKEFKHKGHGGWFDWQPRFYDEIVRNDERLQQIRSYICHNPQNWDVDEYNPRCIK